MQTKVLRQSRWLTFATVGVALMAVVATARGYAQPSSAAASDAREQPFIVDYYYKAKWGYAEEFLTLFKKNHYPVLKQEMALGRIVSVTMASARYHTTEDGRWDYRVTIVWKNAAIANDDFDSAALTRKLYPDQARFKNDEQRRFEILAGHWDVPVKNVDLEAR